MDPKRKFFLFKQAKHFCSVPWNHFKVDMSGQVSTCTNGENILGNINANTVNEILSESKFLEIKQDLLNVDPQPSDLPYVGKPKPPTSTSELFILRSSFSKFSRLQLSINQRI